MLFSKANKRSINIIIHYGIGKSIILKVVEVVDMLIVYVLRRVC